MPNLQESLPGCILSHDTIESVVVNWKGITGGVRYRPNDGRWTVSAHDLAMHDMDTAEELVNVVVTREGAIAALCGMMQRLERLRDSGR